MILDTSQILITSSFDQVLPTKIFQQKTFITFRVIANTGQNRQTNDWTQKYNILVEVTSHNTKKISRAYSGQECSPAHVLKHV